MSVSLRQLEIFHTVVVTGSISRAARRMGLSQPTVSQQLAKMEETLGTPLFLRNREFEAALTPPGAYWFRCASELLSDYNAALSRHEQEFGGNRLVLRFGANPSLRGRFLSAAARLAVANGKFSRFNYVWGTTSNDLVEQMNRHQLDCAVVSDISVEEYRDSFSVTPLFQDKFAWIVPAEVPEEVVREVVMTRISPGTAYEAMNRYVDVSPLPISRIISNWYRANLPFALPYFGCMTFQAAVDIVAAGLATCHSPLSLFPNLPPTVTDRLRIYEFEEIHRKAVLIMPKHLLSIPAFARFREELVQFTVQEYSKEMQPDMLDAMPQTEPSLQAVEA